MKLKGGPIDTTGVRIGGFAHFGHRSHTNWRRMIRSHSMHLKLEAEERRLNAMYVTREELPRARRDGEKNKK